MEQQPFSVPNWWGRYNPQAGRGLSTMDQSTLTYLSQNFNVLPILLLPVDYSLPLTSGTLTLTVPPPPLPQACAHEAAHTAALSLDDLEGLMGEVSADEEGELAELGQWYARLEPAEKRAALASVAKSLSFHDAAPAPAASAALRMPVPAPSLTVFADSQLSSSVAEPAAAAAAAAPARAPLGDRTNQASMKQLSSKLHVAASKKVAAQVPEEDAKELLAYQLSAAACSKEASFAPWHRSSAPHGGKDSAKPAAGTGTFLRC